MRPSSEVQQTTGHRLRGALAFIVATARAEGVSTLQITGTFANPELSSLIARLTQRLGGAFASVDGVEMITFNL